LHRYAAYLVISVPFFSLIAIGCLQVLYILFIYKLCRVLESVELKVDDSWLQQMRLASTSQALAARLLMQGSARQSATSATASAGRPLLTPRSLEAAEQKVATHKITEGESNEDTIAAVHATENTAPQGNKSLVFRPIKKAVSKAVRNKKQALVEVDLPVPRLSLGDISDGPVGNSMVAL
jgi:hypothetical protein